MGNLRIVFDGETELNLKTKVNDKKSAVDHLRDFYGKDWLLVEDAFGEIYTLQMKKVVFFNFSEDKI
jgi:hypothetical protein